MTSRPSERMPVLFQNGKFTDGETLGNFFLLTAIAMAMSPIPSILEDSIFTFYVLPLCLLETTNDSGKSPIMAGATRPWQATVCLSTERSIPPILNAALREGTISVVEPSPRKALTNGSIPSRGVKTPIELSQVD